jgi:hypothetical protein
MINIVITQKLNELTNKQIILLDKEIIRLEKLNKSIKYKNSDMIDGVKQESFYIKYGIISKNQDMINEIYSLKHKLTSKY